MRNDFERQVRGQCCACMPWEVARSHQKAGRAQARCAREKGTSQDDRPSEPRRSDLPWELGAVVTTQAPLLARASGQEQVLVIQSPGQCS